MAISQDEREFFVQLGVHIAQLRRDSQITQSQLAQILGLSQPTINAYELGQRRVPVSALSLLACTLGVSVEDLIDQASGAGCQRGATHKMMQYMDRINALPKPRQRAVMNVIEAMLAQSAS